MSESVYRLTDAGRNAWESQDTAIPADYRLILWLIDFHGHDSLKNLANRFPADLLRDWLGELEELRLIESVPPGTAISPGLATDDPGKAAAVSEEHLANFRQIVDAASASLSQVGAFVAESRVRNRPPLQKEAADTLVLIVEDDPDQLALADLRVTMAGYSVRVANSVGALFRTLAEKGAPDLLVLDVMLPDGDGFEILANLRAHRLYASLPVVLLTAKNDPEDIGRGLQLGADGYVTKPYSKNILARIVSRVLQQTST